MNNGIIKLMNGEKFMNIFLKLQKQDHFSSNEKIVANYILKKPQAVLNMSYKELGQACFVSPATVYRLCDKLELSGFSDLKMKITSSLPDYLKCNDDFDFDFPVKQYQTHYEIVHNLGEDYKQTIDLTGNLFDLEQLRLVASAMKKAQVIDLYTSAGNIYFALNFQFQMQEIGVHVHVPIEDYQQRLTAASSDENHLAVVITFGGRGVLTEVLPRILSKVKTPIVLISSRDYSFKDIEPDYHLYLAHHENHYKKISSFSTRLSLLYILDTLYTSYFELDYQKNLDRKLYYYENLVEGKIK